MAKQADGGIAWTDETWNPVRGCSRVSQGCVTCYAERVAARFSGPGQPYEGLANLTPSGPRWTGKVEMVEGHLLDPLRWKRPRRVFVNSMADLFHEGLADADLDRIFAVMALAQDHTFQCLTKRPERILRYLSDGDLFARLRAVCNGPCGCAHCLNLVSHARRGRGPGRRIALPLPNCWLGVSVEAQATADERIPLLLKTPAAVRFISAEPLLGPISLRWAKWQPWKSAPGSVNNEYDGLRRLDWVIVGGESGPEARPMQIEWAQSLQQQCANAGVSFFMKQLDGKRKAMTDFPESLRVREFPNAND